MSLEASHLLSILPSLLVLKILFSFQSHLLSLDQQYNGHYTADLSLIDEIEKRTIFLTPKDLVKYSKDDLPRETWELIPEMSIDHSEEQILIRQIQGIME